MNLALDHSLQVRQAHSDASDEAQAVRELASQLDCDAQAIVLFFCSPTYDLPRLAAALRQTFPCTVIGCTSAGQLGPLGYHKGGVTAASLLGAGLRAKSYLIPLDQADEVLEGLSDDVRERALALDPGWKRFGLLLVDGLSGAEERLASSLFQTIGRVPLVGGSAGDDLALQHTWVYDQGRFLDRAATFTLFETTLAFRAFKFQHFGPSAKKLVVTGAVPGQRTLTELNGLPAGEAYAEALGLAIKDLDARRFIKHPLLLRLGEGFYPRAIRDMQPDLSLRLHCAVEEGMVLTLGQAADALATVNKAFDDLGRLLEPKVVIGCASVLRRLEFEQEGLDAEIGQILARNHVVGFNSYGEQYNALHMNQSFTGIALGENRAY